MRTTVRRGRVLAAAVVFLAGALSACSATSSSAPAVRVAAPDPAHPNIVFVLTDDLSTNLVTPQFMPNLTALRKQGSAFSDYFVTDSLCCPSRTSILTGRYPHDTGVYTNDDPDGGYDAFIDHQDGDSTVSTDLQAAGYRTALMGKYLNGYSPQRNPIPPGWDEWDVSGLNGYNEFNYQMNENGHIVKYGGPKASQDNYLTDVLSGLGQKFMTNSTAAGKPFFLELSTFAPHSPSVPAPRDAHLYPSLQLPKTPALFAKNTNAPRWLAALPPVTKDIQADMTKAYRLRARSVAGVDDMIGALVKKLKALGQWNNTYLVFSSDNGYHIGEHRIGAGKLTAFDTDIRVPLIVVGPNVAAGKTIPNIAENVDLRSTFDAFAGTTPADPVDGRSLAPLIHSAPGITGWPRAALVEHHGPPYAANDPDRPAAEKQPLSQAGNPPSYEAMRTKSALYVEYVDGEHEYYDLTKDPYELDNTYAALPSATKKTLHAQLVRLEHCSDQSGCDSLGTS